jgi:hypothetical protein
MTKPRHTQHVIRLTGKLKLQYTLPEIEAGGVETLVETALGQMRPFLVAELNRLTAEARAAQAAENAARTFTTRQMPLLKKARRPPGHTLE